MEYAEHAVCFECEGDALFGVAAIPAQPNARAILIVTGGPQYRAGSHRQFVLLARALAACGIASLRFDYRGMGDSEGQPHDFEQVQPDLRCATDALMRVVPQVRSAVMWGLCDGATASLFYAPHDPRIEGLVLLNPWVRTQAGAARATLSHYYRARMLEAGLWQRVLSGRFSYRAALASLVGTARAAFGSAGENPAALPARMLASFSRFGGRVLLVLSGNDLTAHEFRACVQGSRAWRSELGHARVAQRSLPVADHTFARREWRDQAAQWTCDWLQAW